MVGRQAGRQAGRGVTSGADPLGPIDALIAERREALDALAAALDGYRHAFGAAVALPAASRRRPLVNGALPERILSAAAAGPVSFRALVEGAKAPASAVRKAIEQLLADGRLEKTGQSRATRYTRAE